DPRSHHAAPVRGPDLSRVAAPGLRGARALLQRLSRRPRQIAAPPPGVRLHHETVPQRRAARRRPRGPRRTHAHRGGRRDSTGVTGIVGSLRILRVSLGGFRGGGAMLTQPVTDQRAWNSAGLDDRASWYYPLSPRCLAALEEPIKSRRPSQ